jgi:large subunit ribosomal protein L6
MRSRINSLVTGVSTGWSKSADINGVGRNAAVTSDGISLFLGKSHRDVMSFGGRRGSNVINKDVSVVVNKNTKVVFSGIDRAVVGDSMAKMARLRRPEPYKLSGIIVEGAIIEKKVGKKKR